MAQPFVTTRIWDTNLGVVTSQFNGMISFGTIAPASKSKIVIIDSVITGVKAAGDLGIGIASADVPEGNLIDTMYFDVFPSLNVIQEPQSLFGGIFGQNGESNVVSVGFRESSSGYVSNYVALMIKAPDRPVNSGCIVLKWFFGFEKEE